MKKQNTKYSTFTSYLSKTNKNVDMYRLYNPMFDNFNYFSYAYDINFYGSYFKRHFITKRNFLTIFSIYCYKLNNERFLGNKKTYMEDKSLFIKTSIKLFKYKIVHLSDNIDNLNISFRGGNVIFISQFGKKEEISYFTLSKIAGDIFDIKDFSMSNEKLLAA